MRIWDKFDSDLLFQWHFGPRWSGRTWRHDLKPVHFNIKLIMICYFSGAVAQDGRVEPGDMILEVNGVSFENMSNDDAVRTLREAVQKPG